MATNKLLIDPQLLAQAKTSAQGAAAEKQAFAGRMGTLIAELSQSIEGMDGLGYRISNSIASRPERLVGLQNRLKENSQRAQRLGDMIQAAIDQGEQTEKRMEDSLDTVVNTLLGLLGFRGSAAAPKDQNPGAVTLVAAGLAALTGTFGLTVSAVYTGVQAISSGVEKVYEVAEAQLAQNHNLTAYVNSSHNWSPKYKGKANDYSDFSVVKGFDERFVLNQRDYYNPEYACTATSDAIAASIATGKLHEPNASYWTGGDCNWPNTEKIPDSKLISVEEKCRIICENIQQGNPVVFSVPGHTVIAVGIRQGVDPANATPSDILIIDPGDAKVKNASEIYSGWYDGTTNLAMTDNLGWLRVPKR